jgi:hypothetical protein
VGQWERQSVQQYKTPFIKHHVGVYIYTSLITLYELSTLLRIDCIHTIIMYYVIEGEGKKESFFLLLFSVFRKAYNGGGEEVENKVSCVTLVMEVYKLILCNIST